MFLDLREGHIYLLSYVSIKLTKAAKIRGRGHITIYGIKVFHRATNFVLLTAPKFFSSEAFTYCRQTDA